MSSRRIVFDQLFLVVFGGVLYLSFLGGSRLWDLDEPFYTATAREMLEHADWYVPRLNGSLNTDKPILLMFPVMISARLFGMTEFSARLPSVVMGIGIVLLTYRMGLYLFNRPIAFRAAFILATMLIFCYLSRTVMPDVPLTFWIMAAMFCYVAGTFRLKTSQELEDDTPPMLKTEGHYFPASTLSVVGMYAAMGFGVLVKGPLGFLLPTAVIGLFLLLKRLPPGEPSASANIPATIIRPFHPLHFLKTCLAMRLGLGIFVMLLVAAPWFVAVGIKTDGVWPKVFFLHDHLTRLVVARHGHSGPVYYYVIALLFNTFPWSVFFIPCCLDAVKRLWRGTPFADGLTLTICWSLPIMFGFSFSVTKLPEYIVPMIPAAAMIYGLFFHYWSKNKELVSPIWMPLALGLLIPIGIAVAVGFAFAGGSPFISGAVETMLRWGGGLQKPLPPPYFPGEAMLAWIGGVLAIGGGSLLLCWTFSTRRNVERMFRIVAVVFLAAVFWWGFFRVGTHQRYVEMFEAVRAENPQAEIVIFKHWEPSWIYYYGKPMRVLDAKRIREFLTMNGGYALARENDYKDFVQKNPDISLRIVAVVPYMMRRQNLVVVTPGPQVPAP